MNNIPSTLAVHRVRFIEYNPSPVTALALPPLPPPSRLLSPLPPAPYLRPSTLAVGHANGNIDLCVWAGAPSEIHSPQSWVLHKNKTLPGHIPIKVDNLLFTLKYIDTPEPFEHSNLRLFSTGGGSELLEWDVIAGSVLRTISSQGGTIWSIAANPASSLIALGCDDGAIRLLSLEDGCLEHYRRLDRTKARLLSVAWGPASKSTSSLNRDFVSDEDDGVWEDSWIVAGCSDSCLRKFDLNSGRVVERMLMDKAKNQRTLVWTVGCLSDGTTVSGDSTGAVKFWSARTSTQIASFTAHGADVLALAIGPDDNTVYTTGVDQKISQFSLVDSPSRNSSVNSSRWVHASSRRMHSHDVRALTTWPTHQPFTVSGLTPASAISKSVSSFVVSGGLDMAVCICPCIPTSASSQVVNLNGTRDPGSFEDAYYRRMPYGIAASAVVQVSSASKSILCRNDDMLILYRLNDPPEGWLSKDVNFDDGDGWTRVAELQLRSTTNLMTSAISNDGEWIAVSDYYEAKLFHLNCNTLRNQFSIQRIKSLGDVILSSAPHQISSTGASAMTFTPDSQKLILCTYSSPCTLVIELPPITNLRSSLPRVLWFFSHSLPPLGSLVGEMGLPHPDENNVAETIESGNHTLLKTRPTGSSVLNFAVSRDAQWLAVADSARRVNVFNLDTLQHHCALPSFPYGISSITFDPTAPAMLYIGFKNNSIQIFDVEVKLFPEWSLNICATLPKRFMQLHDSLQGLLFNPPDATSSDDKRGPKSVYAWGSSWICKLNLHSDINTSSQASRKRGREESKNGDDQEVGKPDKGTFEICTRYRNILSVSFLGAKELLVVERPIIDVLRLQPPAFFRPKYGSA